MRAHHLEESLRTLKLFGMLDTVEARLAQASAGELGHVELLQSLCEDESTRRDAVGLERRLKAARFEQSCAIEDFDFAFNPKIPATQIRDLATLRFIEAGESVILHGPVGVGKSMIAQALGHLACRRGYSVLFTKTSRLLADLAGGHADRSFESRLARWARPSVVVFDDFAMRDFTLAQASTRWSPNGPASRRSSPPTVRRRTGTPCSRTLLSRSRFSIGSRTRRTTCTWTARATAPTSGPGRTRGRGSEPTRHLCRTRVRQRGGAPPRSGGPPSYLLLQRVPSHRDPAGPERRDRPRRRSALGPRLGGQGPKGRPVRGGRSRPRALQRHGDGRRAAGHSRRDTRRGAGGVMILFRTDVVKVPPTPLGLLPEGWSVQHLCRTCRQMVGSDELVSHAQQHADGSLGRDEPDAD